MEITQSTYLPGARDKSTTIKQRPILHAKTADDKEFKVYLNNNTFPSSRLPQLENFIGTRKDLSKYFYVARNPRSFNLSILFDVNKETEDNEEESRDEVDLSVLSQKHLDPRLEKDEEMVNKTPAIKKNKI